MASLVSYNQNFPLIAARPGTQILEITASDDGLGGATATSTATFPKPFRSPPRILSWTRGNSGAGPLLTRLLRFSSLTPTGLVANFSASVEDADQFRIYVLGEIAPS